MPILTNRPEDLRPSEPTKKSNAPVITAPEYRGNTVDTRYEPRASLISHIEGSPWVVTYYQQQLGADSELNPQSLDKNEVYQQYIEIANLEIKVSSPLTQSQDEESKAIEVTGESTLYPSVVPNKGDMFLADIGDGKEGVFSVTGTERLTILKDTCYRISYILVSYSTPQRREDLQKKTIKRTHFVKKLMGHGTDPIVVNSDYHRYLSLGDYREQLMGQYFGHFFDKTIASLAVPGQTCITFDPFLVRAVMAFTETTEHPVLRQIKNYSVELPEETTPITIWDSLLRFSTDILPLAQEKLGLVNSQLFGIIPQFEGVNFSNVDRVVYPVSEGKYCFEFEGFKSGGLERWDIRHQFDTTRLGSLQTLEKGTGEGIDALYPIHNVTKDEYYVFSEAFYYKHDAQQSQLEALVRNAIEGQPINQRVLVELCEGSTRWGKLEKFYYIPILLILIKMVRHGH